MDRCAVVTVVPGIKIKPSLLLKRTPVIMGVQSCFWQCLTYENLSIDFSPFSLLIKHKYGCINSKQYKSIDLRSKFFF